MWYKFRIEILIEILVEILPEILWYKFGIEILVKILPEIFWYKFGIEILVEILLEILSRNYDLWLWGISFIKIYGPSFDRKFWEERRDLKFAICIFGQKGTEKILVKNESEIDLGWRKKIDVSMFMKRIDHERGKIVLAQDFDRKIWN